MTNKRVYRKLTPKQLGKVKSLTKKGKTQAQIAKSLGIAKQSIATAQRKQKLGVRRPSPFWSEVKQVRGITGISHKEATRVVYHAPKWGKKRHGGGYLSPDERYAAMRAKRKEFDYKGKLTDTDQRDIDKYGDEIGLGDTPK